MGLHNPGLKQQWDQLLEANPRTRIRDAAQQLNVSEMELLATGMPETAQLLKDDFKEIMSRLTKVGKVMSLVRNDIAVHERSGSYPKLHFSRNPNIGTAKDNIELNIHFSDYCYAFAAQLSHGNNTLRSIQFFNKSGHALQKIYLKNEDFIALWDDIVKEFTNHDFEGFNLASEELTAAHYVDVDCNAFKMAWSEMTSPIDEPELLKDFGLRRFDALKVLDKDFAWQVSSQSINQLMNSVSAQNMKTHVFVGNTGVTQSYSGPFKTTREMGDWMNVLDPNFNLHVLNSAVNQAWVVKRPTQNGSATSLEIYDQKGNIALQFSPNNFYQQKESSEWKTLLETLPKA